MSEKKELNKNKIALIVLMVLIAFGCIVDVVDVVKTKNISSIVMLVYYAFIVFYAVYGYKIPHGNLLKVVVLSFSFVQFIKCFTATTTILVNSIFFGVAIIMIAFMSGRLDRLKQNNIIAVVVLVCLLVPNVIGLFDAKEEVPADLQTVEPAPMTEPGQEMPPMAQEGQQMPPMGQEGQGMLPMANPDQEMLPMENVEPDPTTSFIMGASNYSSALLWVVIVSAYNIRYLTHKEAGLKDE